MRTCRACRTGRENLCRHALFTGWDADGGFAQYAVIPEAFVHRLPDDVSPADAAPLLCSGLTGYRAFALQALDRGGTLAVAGIHLSDIAVIVSPEHLFRERTPTSVTANTRADGEEPLRMATTVSMRAHVRAYALDDADRALHDLSVGAVSGAAVLEGAEAATPP